MKIKITFLSMIFVLLSTAVFAQKQDAAVTIKDFYRFHFSHEDIFNQKEVSQRQQFFTPKLRQFFNAELKRQRIYFKKYPDNKPFFDGLPFQPIEFCEKDYRVGAAKTRRQKAIVEVHFVYGKSSCEANDGTPLLYKVSLLKLNDKWLIDDVAYDDGDTLIKAFSRAQKIRVKNYDRQNSTR